MKNPIIYRYVTQASLKIVSFTKTIFNAKGSEDKVGGKLLKSATNFEKILS